MNDDNPAGHGPAGHRARQPRPEATTESRLLRAHRREPACSLLPEIVVMTARRQIAAGQAGQARQLLNRYLHELDLIGPSSDPRLVEVARFCAEFLLSCGCDPDRQLQAAQFAYRSTLAFGDLTAQVTTGDLLGRVADAQGRFRLAVDTRTHLMTQLQSASCDIDTAVVRLALAQSLHQGGRCGEAIRHAHHLWTDWRHRPQRRLRHGIGIAIGYAEILTGCALQHEADQLLAQCLDTDAKLAAMVGPIVLDSPLTSGILQQHRNVCARNLTDRVTGPDIDRAATADRTWQSSAGTP
jgi:hypothetical protein